jgi:hypothetical protein
VSQPASIIGTQSLKGRNIPILGLRGRRGRCYGVFEDISSQGIENMGEPIQSIPPAQMDGIFDSDAVLPLRIIEAINT